MQVEVCVQDYGEDLAAIAAATPQNPVPPELWEAWFQSWLEVLQPDLSPIQAYELSLRLTGDQEVHTLNRDYRQQDKPTDVLAFAALESMPPQVEELETLQPLYLGDIVISLETAQRQAQTQGHDFKVELAWLASHGLLHLLGWDHPDDDQLQQMLNQQQVLLQKIGLEVLLV